MGHYMHVTKIGVAVVLQKENEELAKDVCMHIAAMKPRALNANDIPQDFLYKDLVLDKNLSERKRDKYSFLVIIFLLYKSVNEFVLNFFFVIHIIVCKSLNPPGPSFMFGSKR